MPIVQWCVLPSDSTCFIVLVWHLWSEWSWIRHYWYAGVTFFTFSISTGSNVPILLLCLILLSDLFVQGGHKDSQRHCSRGSHLSGHRQRVSINTVFPLQNVMTVKHYLSFKNICNWEPCKTSPELLLCSQLFVKQRQFLCAIFTQI